jgi:methylase of polypeptide subunit release factors
VTETIERADIERAEAAVRPGAASLWLHRALRRTVHALSYHLILKRQRTTMAHAAGFSLLVRPTVFHPRYFLTSEYLAGFIGKLDLKGKRVLDVGTGSGVLALAAARAGAASVVALDVNPNAACTAADNAHLNGLGGRVTALCSNLMSALTPGPLFDVMISNPPYFAGEARDLADRAWHAGADHRHIASLFDQARERLKPGGRIYIVISSHSDLDYFETLYARARLRARLVAKRWIVIESMLIYELRAD